MNKEYIYINNEEIVVTDENGHATKRAVESDNMHDLLLLENNLEEVNNLINEIEKEETKYGELIRFTPLEKVFAYTLPFWLSMAAAGLAAGSGFVREHILMTAEEFAMFPITGVLLTGVVDIGLIFEKKKDKKFTSGREAELSKAYEIKENLEKELIESKVRKESIELDKSYEQETNAYQNEVVVLDNNPAYEEIVKQLEDSYAEGYTQRKTNKRVLRKTK